MADTPNPRSRSQILGSMITAFLARTGVPNLPKGNPIRSILESAAQSDLRTSQDIFNFLKSLSLDLSSGIALDRIGFDEGVQRLSETASQGTLTVSDTSFEKIESRVYQGAGAPVVGSTTIKVEDATDFPSVYPFEIYLGRGTTNYEGPIEVTNKTNAGSYWTLTLSTPTTRFHQLGEKVTLAQGGDRSIPAGTLAKTSGGATGAPVNFRIVYAATIPDGETEVTGVQAVCQTPGALGNAVANSIVGWQSAPFTDAAVTNPTPFINGRDTENDDDYRERIRKVRQSRVKGTALAIKTSVDGIVALDENKTVTSSYLVQNQDEPAVLYIDDGTGYEEQDDGIAYETLIESAVGGEQYFQLASGRPVAKAYLQTSLSAPFELSDDSQLAFEVAGERTAHTFSADDFDDITSASAYEVASSINGDSALDWSARIVNNGTQIAVFAKENTNEDIQNVAADTGVVDANDVLGFGSELSETLRLFQNDQLLTKDGRTASITSKAQSVWDSGAIVSGGTLGLTVDNIDLSGLSVVTFNDSDFVDAGTGYTTVSASNSLESWAEVFNYKIPGITATVSGSSIVFTSNRGASADAQISIDGTGTMDAAFFGTVSDEGADADYTMDRNLGQIKLATPLSAGDKLTANSEYTRAFLETPSISDLTIAAEATSVAGETGAELWFMIDGAAEIIPTAIAAGSSCAVSLTASPAWGDRVRYTFANDTLTNVQVGDWLIITDTALNIANRGAYRIAELQGAANYSWLEVEQPAAWANVETVSLSTGNIWVVRGDQTPQRVFIDDGTGNTAYSIAEDLNTYLVGATAEVYQTSKVRLRTNSLASYGDIALIGANETGKEIGFTIADAVSSNTSSLGYAVANHLERGTPQFTVNTVATAVDETEFTVAATGTIASHHIVYGLRPLPDAGPLGRYSNAGFDTQIIDVTGAGPYNIDTRTAVLHDWLPSDRFYTASPYAITARDQLITVLDGDDVSGRFAINMYRRVAPTSSTYGLSNDFDDADNGNLSLAVGFGLDFNWNDFAVFMKARVKDDATILWRYYRHGPEGDNARLQYVYQDVPDADAELTVDNVSSSNVDIGIKLPSGSLRTVPAIRNSSKIGMAIQSQDVPNSLYNYIYVFNLAVASATRQTRLAYAAGSGSPTVAGTVTGGTSGATGTIAAGSAANLLILTGVVGIFQDGEALVITGVGGSPTASGTQYGYTTLTLTLPGAITNHGISASNSIYLTSSSGSYTTGIKTVAAVTATTVSYVDTVATPSGPDLSIGTVSRDTQGEVSLTGSTVVVGDLINVADGTDFPAAFDLTLKTNAVTSSYVTAQYTAGPVSTTLAWYDVNDSDNLQFYPIGASNSTANIIADIGTDGIIYGTEISAGSVSNASYEAAELGGADPWYYLSDGINYVLSHTTPPNTSTDYNFTFKNAVAAGLATNSDWLNEDVRLVPITAANVADYLNIAAVSGLFNSSQIEIANEAAAPQIATDLIGSDGSVEIRGGGANANVAPVVGGSSTSGSGTMYVSVVNADAEALMADSWVSVINTEVAPKAVFDASTQLTSIAADGTVTLNSGGTKAWTWANGAAAAVTGSVWQVEKHGNYVAIAHAYTGTPDFSGVAEGDWVTVATGAGPTPNTLNFGTFRVVRIDATNDIVWIENPDAVEQICGLTLSFRRYNSIMPGDTIVIGSTLWGDDNVGTWTVASLGATQWIFNLDISDGAPTAQGAVAALGANSDLFQCREGEASKLTKRIIGISPNSSNSDLTDIKFETDEGYANVGEVYGSYLRSLDKLMFQVDESTGSAEFLTSGVDGYRHNTGLIAEANRVIYGDESDSTAYPGVAAAGAQINISGPLVRRVEISVALRVRTGVSTVDIENQVKSSIANVVNRTGVGSSIPLSVVVGAAQGVNGVEAVTILSPTYGTGNDLIEVQPYEKPLVVDVDNDINVSFIGV